MKQGNLYSLKGGINYDDLKACYYMVARHKTLVSPRGRFHTHSEARRPSPSLFSPSGRILPRMCPFRAVWHRSLPVSPAGTENALQKMCSKHNYDEVKNAYASGLCHSCRHPKSRGVTAGDGGSGGGTTGNFTRE